MARNGRRQGIAALLFSLGKRGEQPKARTAFRTKNTKNTKKAKADAERLHLYLCGLRVLRAKQLFIFPRVLRVRKIFKSHKQIGPHKAGRSCHDEASYQPFVSSITTMIDDSTSECRRTATV